MKLDIYDKKDKLRAIAKVIKVSIDYDPEAEKDLDGRYVVATIDFQLATGEVDQIGVTADNIVEIDGEVLFGEEQG